MNCMCANANNMQFGGDPEHIVLNGDSAGAMALVILMASPVVRGRGLFRGVFAESAGVVQLKTKEQVQKQVGCLAQAVGCDIQTSISPLECLRSVNATALQTATCQ